MAESSKPRLLTPQSNHDASTSRPPLRGGSDRESTHKSQLPHETTRHSTIASPKPAPPNRAARDSRADNRSSPSRSSAPRCFDRIHPPIARTGIHALASLPGHPSQPLRGMLRHIRNALTTHWLFDRRKNGRDATFRSARPDNEVNMLGLEYVSPQTEVQPCPRRIDRLGQPNACPLGREKAITPVAGGSQFVSMSRHVKRATPRSPPMMHAGELTPVPRLGQEQGADPTDSTGQFRVAVAESSTPRSSLVGRGVEDSATATRRWSSFRGPLYYLAGKTSDHKHFRSHGVSWKQPLAVTKRKLGFGEKLHTERCLI